MNMKSLLLFLLMVIVAGRIAVAQTSEMTGKVVAVSTSTITLQSDTGVWDIKRSSSTSVTGALKIGTTVTLKYNTPDAQKKEGPITATNPTATPASQ
jgi:hypothetical protein